MRTRLAWVAAAVGAAAVLGTGWAWFRPGGCPPLPQASVARLAAYARKKHNLPASAKLSVQSNELLPGSCVRRLTFIADTSPIPLIALISPDQHYAFAGASDLSKFPVSAIGAIPTSTPPSAAARPPAPLDTAATLALAQGAPAEGPASAPVTIVEFSDFECPYCGQMESVLKDQLRAAPAGSLRLVYREFPLDIHPWAESAAEMADCAAQQSPAAFWRLHDFFFAHQAELRKETIHKTVNALLAGDSSIDPARFHACLANPQTKAAVRADIALGLKYGVQGTPMLFVNGRPLPGYRPAAALAAAIRLQHSPATTR